MITNDWVLWFMALIYERWVILSKYQQALKKPSLEKITKTTSAFTRRHYQHHKRTMRNHHMPTANLIGSKVKISQPPPLLHLIRPDLLRSRRGTTRGHTIDDMFPRHWLIAKITHTQSTKANESFYLAKECPSNVVGFEKRAYKAKML